MASWTTPKTWGAGAVTAAEFNEQLRDNQTWLKDTLTTHGLTSDTTPKVLLSARYGVSLTASVSVNTGVDDSIDFTTEEWDDAAFHSNSVNTARITIPTGGDGTYEVKGWGQFSDGGTGLRSIWFEVNGATSYSRVRVPATGGSTNTGIYTSDEIELVAGDYVRLFARHNEGGTLSSCEFRFKARRVAV